MPNGQTMHTLTGQSQFPATRWTLVVLPEVRLARRPMRLWFHCVKPTGIRCMPTCAGAVTRPMRRRISRRSFSCVCWKGDISIAPIRRKAASDPFF